MQSLGRRLMRAPFPVYRSSRAFTIAQIDLAPQCIVGSHWAWMRRGARVAALRECSLQDPRLGVLRIHLPRTRMKKGRSPSVGPGRSRHADSFSGLKSHVSPRTRLRSAQLRHCCRRGGSAMLRGINESGRLRHSASKSNELTGSPLLPVHSHRGP